MSNPNPAFLLVQKLKSTPKDFTLGVKAEREKKTFQSVNAELYGLVLDPRLRKRIPSNLGGQFATPGANQCSRIY
jgi:hypothetical protein